jgi:hypothetical protein
VNQSDHTFDWFLNSLRTKEFVKNRWYGKMWLREKILSDSDMYVTLFYKYTVMKQSASLYIIPNQGYDYGLSLY